MRMIIEACQNDQHNLSILVTQSSTERIKRNTFFGKIHQSRKPKIESSKKEVKTVFLEKKNEFEEQDESNLSDYRNFWRFIFPDINARSSLIVF